MQFPRASGILLHPTSFPSRFGIGDLGSTAYHFIDFLVDSGQQFWQVLPLGPTGYGNSPYLCYSSLAGNPLLISPKRLQVDGLLSEADFADLPEFSPERVDYDAVEQTKIPLLRKAYAAFKASASPSQRQAFETFCNNHKHWLEDYALFMALKEALGWMSWHRWDPAIAKREPEALEHWRQKLDEDSFFHKFLQFEFFRQWTTLRQYANERSIQIIGDIPFYVAHDSVDVWAYPDNFCLDYETCEPALMAGVPPDYFSETGQLWGNPVYDWEHLMANDFHWWLQRFHGLLEYVDIIRIDHFRGFRAYWAVPGGETTAINGQWIEAPGEALFKTLREKLGQLPILAEDLGIITPDVEALRDQFEFPGMKVLHFAFDSGDGNPYLPWNYWTPNCVVYTGTHDNNTTVGWFEARLPEEKDRVLHYIGGLGPDGIHWDLIRYALSSGASIAIIPLQDVLGLGSEHRMNTPSRPEGNWTWRYHPDALTQDVSERLRHLTETYDRAPRPVAQSSEVT